MSSSTGFPRLPPEKIYPNPTQAEDMQARLESFSKWDQRRHWISCLMILSMSPAMTTWGKQKIVSTAVGLAALLLSGLGIYANIQIYLNLKFPHIYRDMLKTLATKAGLDPDALPAEHTDHLYEARLRILDASIPLQEKSLRDPLSGRVFRYPVKVILFTNNNQRAFITIDLLSAIAWLKNHSGLPLGALKDITVFQIISMSFDQEMVRKIQTKIIEQIEATPTNASSDTTTVVMGQSSGLRHRGPAAAQTEETLALES